VELACGANERELKATLKGDMLTAPEQSKQDRSKFSPTGGECVCVGCIWGGGINVGVCVDREERVTVYAYGGRNKNERWRIH
jgi:hypothetical protein